MLVLSYFAVIESYVHFDYENVPFDTYARDFIWIAFIWGFFRIIVHSPCGLCFLERILTVRPNWSVAAFSRWKLSDCVTPYITSYLNTRRKKERGKKGFQSILQSTDICIHHTLLNKSANFHFWTHLFSCSYFPFIRKYPSTNWKNKIK